MNATLNSNWKKYSNLPNITFLIYYHLSDFTPFYVNLPNFLLISTTVINYRQYFVMFFKNFSKPSIIKGLIILQQNQRQIELAKCQFKIMFLLVLLILELPLLILFNNSLRECLSCISTFDHICHELLIATDHFVSEKTELAVLNAFFIFSCFLICFLVNVLIFFFQGLFAFSITFEAG